MRPAFVFRLSKPLLISAAAVAIAAGVSTHAVAEKNTGGENRITSKASSFFSFQMGNRPAQIMRATLYAALDEGRIDALEFLDTEGLSSFYSDRDSQPLWVDIRNNEHPRAATVLHTLEQAWTHGLNPEQYHAREIAGLIGARLPAEKAHLELLVSDGLARYAHDLTGMRLPPSAIRQDAKFWRTPTDTRTTLQSVAGAPELQTAIDDIAPADPLYLRLQQELIALAESPDRQPGEDHRPISFGEGILRPGDWHREVVNLRARLGVAHDPAMGSERRYDDRLAAAVMTFQRQHGLSADGAIGPQTLAIMNRTVNDRIEQLVANMERLRWLEPEKPERYILVNIPSATLWAVENGKVALEMPVIVGRPDRQTKSFTTMISGVRFNPKWTVPPTIKAQDFLPRLIEDPYYLENKGIEVSQIVDGQRITLDSTAIDWASVTRNDLRNLRMVQGAGDDNALGRFRVLMENPYDIYLHDTNTPSLFNSEKRALSSGCIRMADPEAVTNFILGHNRNWSTARMQGILDSGRTSEVAATTQMPVYLLYQTVWADQDGNLVYGSDIYRQDRQLIQAMKSLKAFKIPENISIRYASIAENPPLR